MHLKMPSQLTVGLFLSLLTSGLIGFGPSVQAADETTSSAQLTPMAVPAENDDANALDELDPQDPRINEILKEYDRKYEEATGLPAHLPQFSDAAPQFRFMDSGCYRLSCEIYLQVVRSEQKAYLYIHGRLEAEWLVSTGVPKHGTPHFDQHPNGRIYDAYTSNAYPGGDYKGLGNMPYAVFISGGYAVHGTGRSNWPRLGSRASHGCVRLHPDNAYKFNRLVRANGISQTWIAVD